MASRHNRKRARKSSETLYHRALQGVRWASDTTMSFFAVPDVLTEKATWLKTVIGPLGSLDHYVMKEVTKHPSSWLMIYRRHHLARLLILRSEHFAYFHLEVSDEFAHKFDTDAFSRPADKVLLSYALGTMFISFFTSWGETPIKVDRRCVSFPHLCEVEHESPWTTALQEVHVGINAGA